MRTLSRLLIFLLCVELIVRPLNQNLSFLSPPTFAADCPAGMTFDSTLNRCLTKEETTQVMNATANCKGDKECYKRNAEEAFQKKVSSGEAPERVGENGLGKIGSIAGVAGAVTYAVAGLSKSGSGCASSSYWGIVGGGAAAFIGDQLANMQHKKRLKKIKEDWGKIVNPEQANGDKDKERQISIEAQSEAFEMMARAEDSLAQAAKMKKNYFTIATLAFGVSAAMAAFEIYKKTSTAGLSSAITTCAPKGAYYSDEKESLFSYYTFGGREYSIKEELQMMNNVRKSENFSSVVMNFEQLLGRHANVDQYDFITSTMQENLTKDDESLMILKNILLTAFHNITPFSNSYAQDQSSPTENSQTSPQDGSQKQTSEVNTNAAQAYKEDEGKGFDWGTLLIGGGIGAAAAAKVGDKLMHPETRLAFAGVMSMLSMQMASHAGRQADAASKRAALLRKMKEEFNVSSGAVFNCRSEDRNDPGKPNCYCYTPENKRNPNRTNSKICQQLWAGKDTRPTNYTNSAATAKVCISSSGQADPACQCRVAKTCLKVGTSSLKGLNVGTQSVIASGLEPLNKLANGSLDGASVDAGNLGNLAVKVNTLKDAILNNSKMSGAKKENEKKEKSYLDALMKDGAGINNTSRVGSTENGFNIPSNPQDAVRALDKELESEGPNVIGGAKQVTAHGDSGGDEKDLEFGISPEDLTSQDAQIVEVMKEDLDYGSNDTTDDSNKNIFEVLSSRYQKSGMKRLFDGPAPEKKSATPPRENK